jgi:hypothetical protein
MKWSFLQQMLRMNGFATKWCDWINNNVVSDGHVGIKVNDGIGSYFHTHKGLRQEDPLSLFLFNFIVDMLAILISRAKEDEHINGVVPYLVEDGLSILQYADDTVIFMDYNIEQREKLEIVIVHL